MSSFTHVCKLSGNVHLLRGLRERERDVIRYLRIKCFTSEPYGTHCPLLDPLRLFSEARDLALRFFLTTKGK